MYVRMWGECTYVHVHVCMVCVGAGREGLSITPLTAWSQAAFELAALLVFPKIGLFSHGTLA